MRTLHPLHTTAHVHNAYLRYLKTIYPFQDEGLRAAFWQALGDPARPLVKGPLLESAPPFEYGRSIAALVADGVLNPRFEALCSAALPYDRPLYRHQEEAIVKLVQRRRNVIVATGTGSGKTETFLIPILDALLREEAAGTLSNPGVRALLLYPMNALANDQLKRLRALLAHYPGITFGRYTGETEETYARAVSSFRQQQGGEPAPNELISREQMRAAPPHLLLTNYAMLEYLLLRPEDHAFFDGEPGGHWRFIALDEAHVYDGASGMELAMLLRRLKERITQSEAGRVQCIATSATLGRGEPDFPDAVRFAESLFAERFQWEPTNPDAQDVVQARRQIGAPPGRDWGTGTPALYLALRAALNDVADTPDALPALEQIAAAGGVPAPVATAARADAGGAASPLDAFLYGILAGDRTLHRLHALLRDSPALLPALTPALFGEAADLSAQEALIALVDLAVRARATPQDLPLLPARYHLFARALEGAFACLNASAHPDTRPRVFLSRYDSCPDCAARMTEIAACVRCGATYIAGRITPEHRWQHITSDLHDQSKVHFFLLAERVIAEDEDEAIVSNQELADTPDDAYRLCLRCGAIHPEAEFFCACGAGAPTLRLFDVPLGEDDQPHRCLNCGARSNTGLVYRFLTGQDAPAAVLATALYQQIPPATTPDADDLPGRGRKLLIFSDSRQDAAFFAPYLERTYGQLLRRRLLLKALLENVRDEEDEAVVEDVAQYLDRVARGAGVFPYRMTKNARSKQAQTWVMQELMSLDRRISLEGLGLLQFRLRPPRRWDETPPPSFLTAAPLALTGEEAWVLIALLLDTLRQQGVVTFPDDADPKDEAFAPRNHHHYAVREEGSRPGFGILSWLPTRGSNRRTDLIERLLVRTRPDLTPKARATLARDLLKSLWRYLTEPNGMWREHWEHGHTRQDGVVFRLRHDDWYWVPAADGAGWRCTRCRAVTPYTLQSLCPTHGCRGQLEPLDTRAPGLQENHYRRLYLELEPIPFAAQEHTAQWTSAKALEVQNQFVEGKINALSCSTTFELGVDVGELQAVLMRNVPPTTANYVQRAGRAGRRADSAAFTLTYAQRRSHDLTYFADPVRMVAGRVQPPRVTLTNEKIIRRHLQAVLLAAFFRHEKEMRGTLYKTVGAFFDPPAGDPSGAERLRDYARSRPAAVFDALNRIVPENRVLRAEIGLEAWGWLEREEGDGFLQLLERAAAEVQGDLVLYRELADELRAAIGTGGIGATELQKLMNRLQYLLRVEETVKKRDLIGHSANRNLLPKYGFPADVVELKTDHVASADADHIELQRDLRIAIAEYAPGAEVVAAKQIWTGGGLYKPYKKELELYYYSICGNCRFYTRSINENELRDLKLCPVCGSKLRRNRSEYGKFVKPEFGFVARPDNVRASGESRPRRFYSSRLYFAEFAAPPGQSSAHTRDYLPAPDLSASDPTEAHLLFHYSRFGKLALLNTGELGKKYALCLRCGYGKAITSGQRGSQSHHDPRRDKPCSGTLEQVALGHEFLTDVAALRFGGRRALHAPGTLWLSLTYALLEGAAFALGIRRDDLEGAIHYHDWGTAPSILLIDKVPGGAGHARRITEHLRPVFEQAYARVNNDCCGAETSCYECLRNYFNQPMHDQLQRGVVRDFLKDWLDVTSRETA